MKREIATLVAGTAALFSVTDAHSQSGSAASGDFPRPVAAMVMMAASVPCSDIERSIDFYTKGLGMELTGKVEMGRVTEVTLNFPGGGPYLILQHPRDANIPLPIRSPLNRIGISTPDLKALEGRLTAAGYRLERPINELKQYHVAVGQVEDPDGNHIELVQRTR